MKRQKMLHVWYSTCIIDFIVPYIHKQDSFYFHTSNFAIKVKSQHLKSLSFKLKSTGFSLFTGCSVLIFILFSFNFCFLLIVCNPKFVLCIYIFKLNFFARFLPIRYQSNTIRVCFFKSLQKEKRQMKMVLIVSFDFFFTFKLNSS